MVADLRSRLDILGRAREAFHKRIETEFPAYAQLVDPQPAGVDYVPAALRPGEAVIAIFVAWDRTFTWAVPQAGQVAFAAVPLVRPR